MRLIFSPSMKVRAASRKEWEDFLHRCPGATFFHSYEWYALWARYTGRHFEARIFEFDGKPKALLPLLIGKALKGLVKTYTSSPAGTYGGFLHQADLRDPERKAMVRYLKKISFLSLYETPFHEQTLEGINWNKRDFTQLLFLQDGWDNLFSRWSKGHASAAKKGLREGVTVGIAERDDWPAYFSLYQETVRRWKNGPLSLYDWSFFEELRQLPPERCKLWLAWYDKKPIAGCLCFYMNRHAVYWHGAGSQKHGRLKAVHVLQHHIIKAAIAEGFHWYDFNPSANLEGVIKFKKGFGAVRIERAILEKEPRAYRLLSQLYQKLRRRL